MGIIDQDAMDIFLELQDHAKDQRWLAKTENEMQYWQGVKDGLRKCYAIFTNDPNWEILGRSSPVERPENNLVDNPPAKPDLKRRIQ